MLYTTSGPTKIFIGYDSNEPIAFHVLASSILRRATIPVTITPLNLQSLRVAGYRRPRGSNESTEFSISRFMVPFLSDFKGKSIFMDCDMLCRVDIASIVMDLLDQQDKSVLVCKHDYVPKDTTKFLGHKQVAYPRKNWSSFMVFDNTRCTALVPTYLNEATPAELHRFDWIDSSCIGSLPLEWNWLVGEYAPNPAAKILHYTLGGPWFEEYQNCDHSDEWFAERDLMLIPGM